MKLLIVESPGKIKKIASFLSKDYRVVASYGHVRDLPDRDLGIAFEGTHVNVQYVTPPRSRKYVSILKSAAKDADEIILASDPDREGEAIAWHIAEVLGEKKRFTRIEFHSISRQAVLDAIASPRTVDMNRVNAQQARRLLDRLVGWMASPLCWRRIGKGTSAGRVQSVAVRIVSEREAEIRVFVPKVYFNLVAWLRAGGKGSGVGGQGSGSDDPQAEPPPGAFPAKLIKLDGKEVGQTLTDEATAKAICAELERAAYTVTNIEKKRRKRRAPPPFITSTFQQAASNRHHMPPKRAMSAAQKLYERGLITYMRTDSPNASPAAVSAAREWIAASLPPEYLPEKPHFFKAGAASGAQEAHECIRPVDVTHLPRELEAEAPGDEGRMYRLIWERFVASQMSDAVFDDTTLTIEAAVGARLASPADATGATRRAPTESPRGVFEAKASDQVFAGWLRLTQRDSAEDDESEEGAKLPDVAKCERLNLARLDAKREQTKAPSRYTQASLIRALEKEGIGRPATYAQIMDTILTRGYVEEQKRELGSTPLGDALVDLLKRGFEGHFIELGFTHEIEESLDRVADGQLDWQLLVISFRDAIAKKLEATKSLAGSYTVPVEARQAARRGKSKFSRGKTWRLRSGKYGAKGSGTGNPAGAGQREDVQARLPVPPEGGDTPGKARQAGSLPHTDTPRCPKCDSAMVKRESKYGPFFGCSQFPKCKGTRKV